MASHSPQRARRSQVLLPSQGPNHSAQQRETSRSPSLRERPRSLKTQSMPMVPSINHLYAPGAQQGSPTISNTSAPTGATRMLPIPPDQPPSHSSLDPASSEPRMSPPGAGGAAEYPTTRQAVIDQWHPRAIRPAPAFLKSFTEAEMEEHLKMTEVLADIERSDQPNNPPPPPNQPLPPAPQSVPSEYGTTPYGQRSETPLKDPMERVRTMETRHSPSHPELQQVRMRQREPTRESPKAPVVRQPTSPSNPNPPYAHGQVPTPERRPSPKQGGGYGQVPVVPRRATTSNLMDARSIPYTQTPPLQSITARTPDRSLPVQELEEAEDDSASFAGRRSIDQHHLNRISSPTPSSDLNPEGNSQRYRDDRQQQISVGRAENNASRNGRRADDNSPHPNPSNNSNNNSLSDSNNSTGEDSGSYTPRSPTSNLPSQQEKFYQQPLSQHRLSPSNPAVVNHTHASRVKSRNGSIDGLGLRTIDFETQSPAQQHQPLSSTGTGSGVGNDRPPYVDHRQHVPEAQYRSGANSSASNVDQQQSLQQQGRYPTGNGQGQVQTQAQPQGQHYDHQYQHHVPSPQSSQPHQQQQMAMEPPSPALEYYKNAAAFYAPSSNGSVQGQVYPGAVVDDFQNYSEDPASLAYLHAYLVSPRPDAPIPPTPHSQSSSAPSPSPFIHGGPGGYPGGKGGMQYVPVVPVGSPYPYPFTHVRRVRPLSSLAGPSGLGPNGGGLGNAQSVSQSQSQASSSYDPNHPAAIQEQLAKQWQIYLQNQANGNMTDSTFSPAATPFQGANYNPFTFLHTARLTRAHNQGRDTMSLHSSPSHEPVPLPPLRERRREGGRARGQSQGQGQQQQQGHKRNESGGGRKVPVQRQPPPRVDSTQPRDTSPEPDSSSGEETAGEFTVDSNVVAVHIHDDTTNGPATAKLNGDKAGSGWPVNGHNRHRTNGSGGSGGDGASRSTLVDVDVDVDDNSDDWVDEDDEADESDVLEFEYHPSYVPNSDKRRRKWEVGWEGLVQAFQNLDRQTDTTMLVLAAPPHSSKLYSIRSRSIRRSTVLRNSVALSEVRASFKRLSTQRKNLRTPKPSFLFSNSSGGTSSSLSGDGSDGSNESKEEDLRKALDMALGSLNMLNGMYEMRESRWQEEMKRMQEDKEKMAFYLNQVMGTFAGLGQGRGSVGGGSVGSESVGAGGV